MLEDYTKLVSAMDKELAAYEERPTKASSGRIRKLSLQLGKLGAPLRRHLIKLDKAK